MVEFDNILKGSRLPRQYVLSERSSRLQVLKKRKLVSVLFLFCKQTLSPGKEDTESATQKTHKSQFKCYAIACGIYIPSQDTPWHTDLLTCADSFDKNTHMGHFLGYN